MSSCSVCYLCHSSSILRCLVVSSFAGDKRSNFLKDSLVLFSESRPHFHFLPIVLHCMWDITCSHFNTTEDISSYLISDVEDIPFVYCAQWRTLVNKIMSLRVPLNGIFWLADRLSASQEGLCFLELYIIANESVPVTFEVNSFEDCVVQGE